MPYYRQRRYRKRFFRRRRRWFPSWRTRKTIPRTRRYNRRRTRRRKVKRKRYYRKKIKIIDKQFQPKSIRRCTIIGSKCIFQGSPLRCHHNYEQYAHSMVPELHPGGGGWTIYVFSLDSLYDDYEKMQNIWTVSNCNLPLVRYLGCSFKFYQTENVDYVVTYDTCWPMVDTYLTHADAAPKSMLLKKRKITVPSRKTQMNKKPYKKVRINPPSQMHTHWYFQKDICKTPLVMLTATAMSLTKPFCNDKATSNNISIYCLNPYVFKNLNFQTFSQTTGYYCKMADDQHEDTRHPMYLWAIHPDQNSEGFEITNTNIKQYQLTALCNTLDYKAGEPISNNWVNSKNNWGNPFYHHNLDKDVTQVYISLMSPIDAHQMYMNPTVTKKYHVTKITGPMYYTVRYNPETDKGYKNQLWMNSTSHNNTYDPPDDTNLIIDGFPLYILFWGWTDWVKKAKIIQDTDQNGIVCFKTDQFDVKLPVYIPVDKDFIEGYDPYVNHETDGNPVLPSAFSQKHWFPKLQFQDQSIEKICMSGPACPRVPKDTYLQCFLKYKFYFKWGGCPKTLEKACNPCSQQKWTTPDNLFGRLEIENPNTSPNTQLYDWDWDNDYVKEEAIQRIQAHTTTDTSSFIFTDSKNRPKTAVKIQKTQQTTEETKEMLQQLQQLQQQRQQLQLLLLNRLNTK
nr:MAG: ORF1 [TTV-like mini virus]